MNSEYHICPFCGEYLADGEECGCQNEPLVKAHPLELDEMDTD